MKRKKIKYMLPVIIITILTIMPQVYAKTSIEIKPSSTVYTHKTISEFFDDSIKMKNPGEGLEGSNVDVHMATNMDWAIVSFFSNSAYGTNGEGKNVGLDVTIEGNTYRSTNGNVTGVMNFGKMPTYTAGVISKYTAISDTSEAYANGIRILENVTNNKYVDVINASNSEQAAFKSWYGETADLIYSVSDPYIVRYGLFDGEVGCNIHWTRCDGRREYTTFRPAIWN